MSEAQALTQLQPRQREKKRKCAPPEGEVDEDADFMEL